MPGLMSCLTEVQNAAGRDLTKEEEEYIADEISNIIRRAEGDATKISKGVREASDRIKHAAIIQKRNAALNRSARLKMVDYIETHWADRPELGFEAMLAGVQVGARRGSRNSVVATQSSLFAKHAMGLVADLEEKGLWDLFSKGDMDKAIYDASHAIDKKQDLSDIPKDAVEIAKAIKKHNESMRRLANQLGADIGKLEGFLVSQIHDMARIYKDKDGWLAYMQDNLDWERSFPDVIDEAERAELLDSLYISLSSGVHLRSTDKGVEYGLDGKKLRDSEPLKGIANIGKKMSHDRVLHFKDADAEYRYHQDFGSGKLTENVLYGFEKSAMDIGIMQHLGPNAEANLEQVKEEIIARYKKRKPDPKHLERADRKISGVMRKQWPHVNGMARVPGHAMAAQISQTARAVQQWSKLGGAVLSGLADISFYASEVRYGGKGMLSGINEAMASLGSTMPRAQRARLLSSVGVIHDGMISMATKRFDASDNIPGRVSTITSLFFKYNGLRLWTDQLRTGFALARAHDLGLQANKAYADIDADAQRVLSLYDLGEKEWDVLSKAVHDGEDGRIYMTADGVEDAPDELIASYLTSKGESVTDASIRKARQKIAADFRSYFFDRSSTAVIEPDAKTRSYLYGGTRPGTLEGEMLRHLMLFKSFTASVIQKPLAREIYGRGAMSLKDALKNGNGEMQGLANLIVWNTLFGYAAMSAKDLFKGKTPRDPEDHKTWMAAFVQGGGLGIYGDFLFGDMKSRYGGGAISTLVGPSFGLVEDVTDIAQRARDGDDAAAQTVRLAINNTPFINLFYTKAALDYAILYQVSENMSPGYLRRMEKRAMDDNGQTYMNPPSQVMPTGGGDRLFEGLR